jgi:UDP-4-amino-4,6-dideoxy-N-acetyl-beta-L-altrosamine transaminase
VNKFIPYARQNVTEKDIDAVVDVLRSDFLTQGPQVPLFEEDIKTLVNVGYCVAVNSATSALHIACKALGLGPGDVLWTSPNSFVASANCALYCGASVDFVDIDPTTFNMCVNKLEEKLQLASKNEALPKIVNVVHFAGQPANMKKIRALSKKYRFYVIEDASHAIGAKLENSPVGNCEYSDICVFSFHPVKIVTTGEGGVATTNSHKLAQRMELYRSHGITKDPGLFEAERDGDWYYEQQVLGFNYRMTDIHAALGREQLKRIGAIIETRNKIAKYYFKNLAEFNIKLPQNVPQTTSAMHLFPIQLNSSQERLFVFSHLREANIGVNVHYIPIHLQPFFRRKSFNAGDFPISENFYKKTISLPIFPTLQLNEQNYVIEKLKEVLEK